MDIQPGTRMIVEFPNKDRLNFRYVGESEDEFIILKMPVNASQDERMAEGGRLRLHYFMDGKMVGFESTVLSCQATPVPLVFLSFPHDFMELPLGSEARVACWFPATVAVGRTSISGHIVDMSPEGCRFIVGKGGVADLGENTRLSGTFRTMQGQKEYDFRGRVTRLRVTGLDKGLYIAFEGNVELPQGIMTNLAALLDESVVEFGEGQSA